MHIVSPLTLCYTVLSTFSTVLEARDGRAWRRPGITSPILIPMDLALPVMDGYAALAAIWEDETLRDMAVVVVTAMKGDRESILARGFDGYLSKPIDAEMLKKTINKVLHGKD